MLDYLDDQHDVPDSNEQGNLLIMVGLPGVGKSAVSNALAPHIDAVVLSTDRIRKKLYTFPKYDADESRRVYQLSELLIKRRLLQKQTVIFDATNLWETGRKRLKRIATDTNSVFMICELVAEKSAVKQRLADRTPQTANYSDANWDVYQRLEPELIPIDLPHITLNTSDLTLEETITAILNNWHK